MKLNLGSGAAPMKGFINCDFLTTAYGTQPDVACDLRQLPFRAGSIAEIHAIHVWEHFTPLQCQELLVEWRRVLRAHGLLVLELPQLESVVDGLYNHAIDKESCMRALYGDHFDHKWCWSAHELVRFLRDREMFDVSIHVAKFHQPFRDMRIEARV